MPKVPQSRNQIKETRFRSNGVRTRATRGPDNSKALAQVSGIINQVSDYAEKEKSKAFDSQRKEFENDARRFVNDSLYDPDAGFTRNKGKSAIETHQDYSNGMDDFLKDRLSKVGNEELKGKLTQIGESYRINHNVALDKHTSRESDSHYDEVNKATINSISSDAIRKHQEGLEMPDIDGTMVQLQNEVKSYGDRNDMSEVKVSELQLAATDNLHKEMILSAIDKKQNGAGKSYLEKYKKSMKPETIRHMGGLLKKSNMLGQSQDLAQKALDDFDKPEDALKYIRDKAKDPELQRAAVQEYKGRHTEKKYFKDESRREFFESRGDDLYKNPQAFTLTAKDLDTLNLAEQDNLNRMKNNRLKELRGVAVSTNWNKYSELANMDYNTLKDTDLVNEYGSYLAPTHLKQFIDARAKGSKEYTSFRTKNQTIQALVNRTIDSGWLIDSDASNQDIDYITAMYEDEINQLPPEKRQSTTEQNKVIDRLTLNMLTPRGRMNMQKWQASKNKVSTNRGPVEGRAKNIPRDTVWREVRVKGEYTQGWEGYAPNGDKVLYNTTGDIIAKVPNKSNNKGDTRSVDYPIKRSSQEAKYGPTAGAFKQIDDILKKAK